MTYIQVFLTGAVVVVLATLVSLRRAHIRVEYSVSWLVVGCLLFLTAFFPSGLLRAAASAGIDPQISFVIFTGALVMVLLFEVSLVVSKLRDENVVLTQRLAILEYHLRQLRSGHGTDVA